VIEYGEKWKPALIKMTGRTLQKQGLFSVISFGFWFVKAGKLISYI
jgi:hypothetical protein